MAYKKKEKENMSKEGALNVMPIGYNVIVKPMKSSGGTRYTWEVRRFGRPVDEGVEDSAPLARKYAAAAMLKSAQGASVKHANKSALRVQLRTLLEKRPYLVAGATELILAGADYTRVVSEAEEYEKSWWSRAVKATRVALPTHHRALIPTEAAKRFILVMIGLGYVVRDGADLSAKPALAKWAANTLGGGFAS